MHRNLYIALQRKIFPRIAWRVVYFMLNMKKRFADGNFVWNQDEVPQNSRYAKRFCYSSKLIAQTVRHFYGSGHSFPKIFMFSLRYINCSSIFLACPIGEGAERSEAEGGSPTLYSNKILTKHYMLTIAEICV